MVRPRVLRSLPELPKPSVLGKTKYRGLRLLEILREFALSAQQEQRQSFYSIREVAKRYRVPLATVSRIYRELEREGILSSVRGSKTTLRGLSYDRKLSVRAFIGLPASMSRFVTLQDYRMFFVKIRRELRLRGFAAAMVFLDQERGHNFIKRVHQYEIDTVIWFSPETEVRDAILRLTDTGVRVVGVSDGGLPIFPCHYEIHREAAIKTILRNWRESYALTSMVSIVSGTRRSSAADEQRLHLILQAADIEHRFVYCSDEPIERFVGSLERKRPDGIIFLAPMASMFSFRNPRRLTDLFHKYRVALVGGPVNMPFTRIPDVRIDLVYTDWQLVAERIVNDLISQDAFRTESPVIFEAEARLQVPLSDYAQEI